MLTPPLTRSSGSGNSNHESVLAAHGGSSNSSSSLFAATKYSSFDAHMGSSGDLMYGGMNGSNSNDGSICNSNSNSNCNSNNMLGNPAGLNAMMMMMQQQQQNMHSQMHSNNNNNTSPAPVASHQPLTFHDLDGILQAAEDVLDDDFYPQEDAPLASDADFMDPTPLGNASLINIVDEVPLTNLFGFQGNQNNVSMSSNSNNNNNNNNNSSLLSNTNDFMNNGAQLLFASPSQALGNNTMDMNMDMSNNMNMHMNMMPACNPPMWHNQSNANLNINSVVNSATPQEVANKRRKMEQAYYASFNNSNMNMNNNNNQPDPAISQQVPDLSLAVNVNVNMNNDMNMNHKRSLQVATSTDNQKQQATAFHENDPSATATITANNKFRFRSYQSEMWLERLEELKKFFVAHGHCLVPHNWKDNLPLAQWVKRQRYQYKLKIEGKHSTMTQDRLNTLESLGFVWDSHKAAWQERYMELQQFALNHGHTNVPSTYPENPQLSVWVKCQRRQYKLFVKSLKTNLTEERKLQLDVLGFVWNPRNLQTCQANY